MNVALDDTIKQNQRLIRRCMFCRTIELDEKLVREGDYDPELLKEKGFSFTDGILSVECSRKNYPEYWEDGDERNYKYQTCRGN